MYDLKIQRAQSKLGPNHGSTQYMQLLLQGLQGQHEGLMCEDDPKVTRLEWTLATLNEIKAMQEIYKTSYQFTAKEVKYVLKYFQKTLFKF